MPAKAQGDVIREQGEQIAELLTKVEFMGKIADHREKTTDQRFDQVRRDLDRLQQSIEKQDHRIWGMLMSQIGLGVTILVALLNQLFRFLPSR